MNQLNFEHKRVAYNDTETKRELVANGYHFIAERLTYELEIPDPCNYVEIQLAHNGHLPGVLQVGLAELRHSRLYADRTIPFEVAQAVYRDRVRLAFKVTTVFVAVHIGGEGIVGFCALLDNEIEMIAVATKHQRKGIGRKLVEWCIDVCASRGNKTLIVKTQGDNCRGRKLYMQLGFKRTKIQEDFHKHENTCDG